MNGESAQREQARSCDRTDAAARHASALVGWCKRSSNSRKARLSRDGRPTGIDRSAPVIALHEIDIEAALDAVWQLHVNVNAWPIWQTDITAAHIDGALEPGVSSTGRACSGGDGLTVRDASPGIRYMLIAGKPYREVPAFKGPVRGLTADVRRRENSRFLRRRLCLDRARGRGPSLSAARDRSGTRRCNHTLAAGGQERSPSRAGKLRAASRVPTNPPTKRRPLRTQAVPPCSFVSCR
jgi:hypothetical protein